MHVYMHRLTVTAPLDQWHIIICNSRVEELNYYHSVRNKDNMRKINKMLIISLGFECIKSVLDIGCYCLLNICMTARPLHEISIVSEKIYVYLNILASQCMNEDYSKNV